MRKIHTVEKPWGSKIYYGAVSTSGEVFNYFRSDISLDKNVKIIKNAFRQYGYSIHTSPTCDLYKIKESISKITITRNTNFSDCDKPTKYMCKITQLSITRHKETLLELYSCFNYMIWRYDYILPIKLGYNFYVE